MPAPSRPNDFYAARAKELCEAFASGQPATELLTFFRPDAIAHEHGPDNIPSLPFLGRTFSGKQNTPEGVQAYFELIAETLAVRGDMSFTDFAVDTDAVPLSRLLGNGGVAAAIVTTRGKATFEYKKTGKSCAFSISSPPLQGLAHADGFSQNHFVLDGTNNLYTVSSLMIMASSLVTKSGPIRSAPISPLKDNNGVAEKAPWTHPSFCCFCSAAVAD
jgi:hypothetical protein